MIAGEKQTTVIETRTILGPGAVAAVPRAVRELLDATTGGDSVAVVLGASSTGAAWRSRLLDALRHEVGAVHEHVPGAPTPATVAALTDAIRTSGASAIVAAGGGSVMDAAKAAAAQLSRAPRGGVPVITVPTTPGTGAEVTPFATVWDPSAACKHSESGPGTRPALAVVDPELTLSLPTDRLVSSVLDTIVQGAEAAWSVQSTPGSTALGLTAVALAAGAVEAAVSRPRDIAARTVLSLAGLHGGRAIARSQTGACHAVSYPLTLRHGLDHGHACALTLGAMLAFNAGVTADDCADARGAAHVRDAVDRVLAALRVPGARAAAARIDRLLALGRLRSYSECGIDSPSVARAALAYGRLANNPRRLDGSRLEQLLSTLGTPKKETLAPC